MKVKSSVKRICANCKIIRRNRVVRYMSFAPIPNTNKDKDKLRCSRILGIGCFPKKKGLKRPFLIFMVSGRTRTKQILKQAEISAVDKRAKDLTEEEISADHGPGTEELCYRR